MKPAPAAKPATPPPSRSALLWPAFLVLSMAANCYLAWVAFVPSTPAKVAEPPASPTLIKPSKVTGELAAYASLGSFLAENNHIPDLKWTAPQFEAFVEGERASFEGRGYPLSEDGKALKESINAKVQSLLAAEQPDPVEDYFRTLREREGVQRTPSGLHYRISEDGSGDMPRDNSYVLISYSARLPGGEKLPKLTRARTKTAVKDLLPGLREAVKLLHIGGKALVYLPPSLSFAPDVWPEEIPRGAPVIFFLELHDVTTE